MECQGHPVDPKGDLDERAPHLDRDWLLKAKDLAPLLDAPRHLGQEAPVADATPGPDGRAGDLPAGSGCCLPGLDAHLSK